MHCERGGFFALFGFYALADAGEIRPLPLLRTGLFGIGAICFDPVDRMKLDTKGMKRQHEDLYDVQVFYLYIASLYAFSGFSNIRATAKMDYL